jgi:alpha-beta hydrolase superfamily lysophospholipase
VKTVEDPNRFINRQIARWMRDRDLVVDGVNVTAKLRDLRLPLLCLAANGDGIVPLETARFSFEQIGSPEKSLVVVGDARLSLAHADLFVANAAQELVFKPIAQWLARQHALAVAA